MNAMELTAMIDYLESAKYSGATKAATMLREQQFEIERLQGHLAVESKIRIEIAKELKKAHEHDSV